MKNVFGTRIVNFITSLAVALGALLGMYLVSYAQSTNPTPVFRFYKYSDGSHFMTNNLNEKASVQSGSAYKYEGIAFYSYASQIGGSVPVYRFYNFKQGVHFYTSNQNEATQVNNTAYNTYRYEGVAYYLPTQLSYSGSGNQVSESFILPTTLAVFHLTNSGSSNFIVYLHDVNTGQNIDLLANEIGNADITVPQGVGEGMYTLAVTSSGSWSVTIDQPHASAGYLTSFNGTGTSATQMFSMTAGSKTLSYSNSGSSNFFVTLWNEQGDEVDIPVITSGPTSGGTYMNVPATGNYMLGIEAAGNRSLSIN